MMTIKGLTFRNETETRERLKLKRMKTVYVCVGMSYKESLFKKSL